MSTRNATAAKPTKQRDVWKMTMTAMLSAIAFVLMFFEFSVPIMPSFIKMDLSELPALVGAFAMGPVSGAMVCLVKNLLHLFMTTTGGVGELSNFLLGGSLCSPGRPGLPEMEGQEKRCCRSLGRGGPDGVYQHCFQLFYRLPCILQFYAKRSHPRRIPDDFPKSGKYPAMPDCV